MIVPEWPAPACVRAVVTTRLMSGASATPFASCNLGAHCGDDAAAVAANRASLATLLRLPAPPNWLQQVHGTHVVAFNRPALTTDAAAIADAAITRLAGLVLSVLTADCLPLLVCADDGSEVAAIHAGWRGLAAGVIERTIAALRTPRDKLMVWLGPAIGARSYEVDAVVRDAFVAHNRRAAEAFVATRPSHWACDLYALARLRLAALKVRRVYGGGFDTFSDERFYSYRRNPVTGRCASLIWMEN